MSINENYTCTYIVGAKYEIERDQFKYGHSRLIRSRKPVSHDKQLLIRNRKPVSHVCKYPIKSRKQVSHDTKVVK